MNYYTFNKFEAFRVSTLMPPAMVDIAEESCKANSTAHGRGEIGVEGNSDSAMRVCKVSWITPTHWVANMMSVWALDVNRFQFKYDVEHWTEPLQVTVYDSAQSHYSWHIDTSPSPFYEGMVRKLTVVLSLSSLSDYEGGELELYFNREKISHRLDKGDILVFPSTIPHRVRKVKSGVRKTIVGWMGGPPFK